YQGSEKFADKYLKDHYKWMMEQMKEKFPNYDGSTYPVWVWKRNVSRNEQCLFKKGTKGVMLTLDIQDEDILWSDFDSWHCILNNSPIVDNEEEWNDYLANEDDYLIEETWQKIFDFDYLRNADKEWHGEFNEEWIQGVTPIIRMDQIKKVTRFIAK
ncbi:DUF3841 domain-containing protein, partial [Bacillus sp. JJ722]|uniref:DUF3841 domain-containing protein n=1 Tax=Bacillus sp. JJ722 TaxID=3122973 RepID=UPI003000F640